MAVTGALTLCACHKANDARSLPVHQTDAISAGTDELAALRKLTPGSRNAVLFRAISDSQAVCTEVADSVYQQDYKGMAMFVARCPGSPPYAVFVAGQGYAQVSPCANLGPGAPSCKLELLKHRDL